jgi:hypothetical protein
VSSRSSGGFLLTWVCISSCGQLLELPSKMFYGDELKAYAEVTVFPLVLIANVLNPFLVRV